MGNLTLVECGECGSSMTLDAAALLFRCTKSLCTATHRATPEGTPMGMPGSLAEHAARWAAHASFDPSWENGPGAEVLALMPAAWSPKRKAAEMRRAAYAWLSTQLGIDKAECHLSRFNEAQCEAVVRAMATGVSQADMWRAAASL